MFTEEVGESTLVFKSQVIRNLAYRLSRITQTISSLGNEHVLENILHRLTGNLTNDTRQISGRNTQMSGVER